MQSKLGYSRALFCKQRILHKFKAQELPQNSGWDFLSLEESLTSLEQMPQPPSVENFTRILHKCRKKKSLAFAQRLHAYMRKSGLEGHSSLGNHLIPMLVEVGSMCDAQQVFNMLVDPNEYAWTSLITGYTQCGESEHALILYQKMQENCVHPTGHTFVALLKACARLKDAERGREIHADIARKGLEKDLFVGSTLVDMYAKCGSLGKAREAFDKLPVRDAVSWNALIAAYAKDGLGEEALTCFEQMQLEGIPPSSVTFGCVLKACGSIGAIDKGRELHSEIARNGLLEIDLFVGSSLVDMYAKCGFLAKAQEAFDNLPVRNEVSWNALIAAYVEHGLGEQALNCFKQLQWEGMSPNAVTFVYSLKACGSIGALNIGTELHADMVRKEWLEKDPFVGNALVDMYAKCGSLAKAREVFDNLPVRDAVSWTALIAGYAEHGPYEEALNCFTWMQREGVSPDALTFVCSLKACGNVGAVDKGQDIHANIVKKGLLERDPFVGSSLVDMYAKCGSLAKAWEVFEKLPVRDVVAWTALIGGYAKQGLGEKALYCFKQMQLEGLSPDALTFVCSLKACGITGAVDKGLEIHAEITTKGLERDLLVGSALVDMYAKCGLLVKAWEVFDKLPARDVVAWTALITGYAYLGESENVFHMLERMKGDGIMPTGVTFLSILNMCNHTGLVGQGQKYFEAMSKDYGITPTIEHYTCMVDILGRAGQLDDAVVMMKRMPFHPNLVMWHTLLGACRKWGNVELGRHAFEHAVQLDKKDDASYILMSNIYTDAHMHDKEKEVEAMRVKARA